MDIREKFDRLLAHAGRALATLDQDCKYVPNSAAASAAGTRAGEPTTAYVPDADTDLLDSAARKVEAVRATVPDVERSTHTELEPDMAELHAAQTALGNADLTLTGDPHEDHDAWEETYSAASRLSDAAEAVYMAARRKLSDAQDRLDRMEPA
jgi:hypothetical protein